MYEVGMLVKSKTIEGTYGYISYVSQHPSNDHAIIRVKWFDKYLTNIDEYRYHSIKAPEFFEVVNQ